MPRRMQVDIRSAFFESKSHTYLYRFVCEECGAETDWLPEEVTAEYTITKAQLSGLKTEDEEKLTQLADCNLQLRMEQIKKEIDKGILKVGNDECPNCNHKQSWSLKGREWEAWAWGAGALILWMVFDKSILPELPLYISSGDIFIGYIISCCIGISVGLLRRLNRKQLFLSMVEDHKLEFDAIIPEESGLQ